MRRSSRRAVGLTVRAAAILRGVGRPLLAAGLAVAVLAGPSPAASQEPDTIPDADTVPAEADTLPEAPAETDTVAPADTVGPGIEDRMPPRARDPGGRSFLGGYAILAYDAQARQLGAGAASSGFSAGSGIPAMEPGRGVAAVLGRRAPEAGRAAMDALRRGATAEEAATSAAAVSGRSGGLQLSVLTPDCESHTITARDAYHWTGSRSGTVGSICYVVAGSLLADSTVLGSIAGAFRRAEGTLLDRLHAGLSAAERAAGDIARSRSGVVWITAPDPAHGALGRAELRLQVDDVQRPADALRYLIRAGRADDLAGRASAAVDAGDYQLALEAADRAIELEPVSALAWLARGRALLYLGRDREAETAFQRMLEVNPYLLHLLGDPAVAAADTAGADVSTGSPRVRRDLIPYRPRLLLRLDTYRRSFFSEAELPSTEPDEAPAPGTPPDTSPPAGDTATAPEAPPPDPGGGRP